MVSQAVILSWPIVVFWLFAKRQPAIALSWSILGGYMLLPRNFSIDLPAVPTLSKGSITALAALAAAAILIKGPRLQAMAPNMVLPGLSPRNRAVRILLVLLAVGAIGTVMTNGDTLRYAARTLPPMRPYDAAALLGNMLFTLLPYLMARKYMAHPDAQRMLLVTLVLAVLLYSLPTLYEARMSPQLSRMIYGYFPHSWIQHMRGGGYRPVVFLWHGLWLAILICGAFLGAMALWRSGEGKFRLRWMLAAGWLFITLVASKGVGALGIGLFLGALIVFLPIRLQVLVAGVLAGTVLIYPMLRGAGMIPTDRFISIAQSVDSDRAASLNFRLQNEDILLAKANERPLFGWGTWGRNRVFDEQGRDISTTDGYWIIAIGAGGWVGYIAQFGLLTIPLILLALRWKSLAITPATAGIGFALTANLIDLIPNGTLTPVTWLLAGALAGRLELGRVSEGAAAEAASLPPRRNAYSRQRRLHPAHDPVPVSMRRTQP